MDSRSRCETKCEKGFERESERGIETCSQTGFESGLASGFDNAFETQFKSASENGMKGGIENHCDIQRETRLDKSLRLNGFEIGIEAGFKNACENRCQTRFDNRLKKQNCCEHLVAQRWSNTSSFRTWSSIYLPLHPLNTANPPRNGGGGGLRPVGVFDKSDHPWPTVILFHLNQSEHL